MRDPKPTKQLVNRSSSPEIDWKSLEKIWLGKPTNYIGLKAFGYPAYGCVAIGVEDKEVHIPRVCTLGVRIWAMVH